MKPIHRLVSTLDESVQEFLVLSNDGKGYRCACGSYTLEVHWDVKVRLEYQPDGYFPFKEADRASLESTMIRCYQCNRSDQIFKYSTDDLNRGMMPVISCYCDCIKCEGGRDKRPPVHCQTMLCKDTVYETGDFWMEPLGSDRDVGPKPIQQEKIDRL